MTRKKVENEDIEVLGPEIVDLRNIKAPDEKDSEFELVFETEVDPEDAITDDETEICGDV